MSPAVVLYTIAVGALVLGVATASASALGYLKRPTRWVWMVALVGTAALPFLPRPPAPAPEPVATTASGEAQVVSDAALARLLASASGTLPAQTRDPLPWLPVLWILGSAATLGLMVVGVRRIRSQIRDWRTRRIDGDRVWVSRAFGPAVIGFLRPEVVLPNWTLDLEPRERRMILLHENEHRRARDPLLLFVGACCLVITPWNPFLWLQFRGLRRAIEFDCDRRVLARGAAPRAYGRLLLSLQLRDGRGALFAPALREPASFLERRLKMMTLRDRPVPRGRVAALAGLAVILGVVACEAPQPVGPEEAPEDAVVAPAAESTPLTITPTIFFDDVEEPVDVDPGDILYVTLAGNGRVDVQIGGEVQPIIPDQLGPVWTEFAREHPGAIAVVRSDSKVPYGEVSDILSTLKDANATRVSVQMLEQGTDDDGPVPALGELPPNVEIPPPPQGQFRDRPIRGHGDREPGNSIDLITADDIEASGVDSTEQILRGRVQGLTVSGESSEGEGSRLSIRGLTSIEGRNSPLIYVDGVRVGTETGGFEEAGTGAASVLKSIRPQDIERIEVIKGSAAETLYGADARHGVIQIFTKAGRGGG